MDKKVLAIIPARGGSKGLPRKNIKDLLGKPLISWTIEQALKAKLVNEIFVTTDSTEIQRIAQKYNVTIPFLRPKHLATDSSSSMDVVQHVLDYYKSKKKYFEYIILLEPTSPLRKAVDIDEAIQLAYENKDSDGVISVGEVHLEHPSIVKKINVEGFLEPYVRNDKELYQRQQFDKAYFPYGVLYLIKTEVFRKKLSFYTNKILPYFIERWQNYEIDDLVDFEIIEFLINKYLKQ